MLTVTPKQHAIRKQILFVIVTFVFLTSMTAIYSAPSQSPPTPLLNESLAHLTLDHYEMDPRTYLETNMPAAPNVPLAPDYLPWSRIVYQSYRTSSWDIFLSDDAGSFETPLATTGDDEILPRLNRGGTRIAFAYERGNDFEIFVMNSDGTNKVQLTDNETDDVNPYWSPDGNKIVFQAYRDGQPEIYVMNADGSGQTRLTNHNDYDGMPSWSPNGAMIAFVSRRTGGYRVYTMDANGANQIQRSDQPYSQEPVWSPNSTQIGYAGDGDNNSWLEVWRMNADGSSQTQRYNPGNEYDAFVRSWSPDGQYIAFAKVHYILYQGNWYWTDSRLEAVGAETGYYNLGPNNPPYRDWYPDWQTLDNQKPTSQVNALPSVSPGPFTVSWSGTDAGGSGFKSYDIQVRDGANGTWVNWKVGVTITTASYPGIGGHTYYFRSRGRDNSFNVEPWPNTHDTSTQVEALPPITTLSPVPAFSRRAHFGLRWNGIDPGGSAIVGYDVQYRLGNVGSWQNLLTNNLTTFLPFNGTSGNTYYFRVRGSDGANNIEEWAPGNGDGFTTLYAWGVTGQAVNNAGVPVTGMNVTTVPSAFATQSSDLAGKYQAYVAGSAGSYMADWSKAGYGDLPATNFAAAQDGLVNIVLPPGDDVIQNGGFETGDLSGWTISGQGSPVITQTTYHTGGNAAALNSTTPFAPPQNFSFLLSHAIAVDSDNNGGLHVLYYHDNALYYRFRAGNGTWSTPHTLNVADYSLEKPQMIVSDNGTVHVTWTLFGSMFSQSRVYYAQRSSAGSWSGTQTIAAGTNIMGVRFGSLAVGNDGKAHVAYESGAKIYYVRQTTSSNTWSSPQVIYEISGYNIIYEDIKMTVDNQNQAHFVWLEGVASTYPHQYKLYHRQRLTDGTLSTRRLLSAAPETAQDLGLYALLVDRNGAVHVMWEEYFVNGGDITIWHTMSTGSQWLTPELVGIGLQADFALDANNQLSAVWSWYENNRSHLYMASRTETGWSYSQIIYSSPWPAASVMFPQIIVDDQGTYHVSVGLSDGYGGGDGEAVYLRQLAGQNWDEPVMLQGESGLVDVALLAVDQHHIPHVVWYKYEGTHGMVHTTWPLATQTRDVTISQAITIPLTLNAPTLSLLYQLNGAVANSGVAFQVQVENSSGNVTTLLTTSNNTQGWEHAWFNMSAWAGQPVTVTFNLHQVAGQPMPRLYLDDVTLGSTFPDIWVGDDYRAVLPGEEVTYAIRYGNHGAAAATVVTLNHTLTPHVTFISASVAPTQINGATLTWNLGNMNAHVGPVTILVTVRVNAAAPPFTTLSSPLSISMTGTELETANNQAAVSLYLARLTYLPIITR